MLLMTMIPTIVCLICMVTRLYLNTGVSLLNCHQADSLMITSENP